MPAFLIKRPGRTRSPVCFHYTAPPRERQSICAEMSGKAAGLYKDGAQGFWGESEKIPAAGGKTAAGNRFCGMPYLMISPLSVGVRPAAFVSSTSMCIALAYLELTRTTVSPKVTGREPLVLTETI